MVHYKNEGCTFYHRTVGVFLNRGRVLLHQIDDNPYWSLPGGRGEEMESSRTGIMREMQEELGVNVTIERMLWAVENFYHRKDVDHHEIGFYYLLSLPEDHELYQRQGPFPGEEPAVPVQFQWHSLEALKDMRIFPAFLPEKLDNLSGEIEHLVNRYEDGR